MTKSTRRASLLMRLKALKANKKILLVDTTGAKTAVQIRTLRQCPHFQNLLNKDGSVEDEIPVKISAQATAAFVDFLEGRPHTGGPIANVFELLRFACCEIRWEPFARHCLHNASGLCLPPEEPTTPIDDICSVVEAVAKYLPLRTFDHYETLLKSLTAAGEAASTPGGDEEGSAVEANRDAIVDRLVAIIEQGTNEYANEEPLDLPLFASCFTIAAVTDLNRQQFVAVLLPPAAAGSYNRKWMPIDLFGGRFCPFRDEAENFHVCFGKSVIFKKADGSVLKKSLSSDEPEEVLLDKGCHFFRSRRNQLHVVHRDPVTQHDTVFEWNTVRGQLDKKFSNKDRAVRTVHRRTEGGCELVIVLETGQKIVTYSDDDKLFRIEQTSLADCVDDWTLQAGNIRFRSTKQQSDQATTYELPSRAHIGFNSFGIEPYCGAFRAGKYCRRPAQVQQPQASGVACRQPARHPALFSYDADDQDDDYVDDHNRTQEWGEWYIGEFAQIHCVSDVVIL